MAAHGAAQRGAAVHWPLGSCGSEINVERCTAGQVAAAPGSRSKAGRRSAALAGAAHTLDHQMNVTAGWVTAQNETQSRWRLQGEGGGSARVGLSGGGGVKK